MRKAAPLVGEYATNDIVCYHKEDQGWSLACRSIGFDGNKTAWLICAVTPVFAAVDRLRPATSAEALAMQFAQNAKYEPGHPEDQQVFVDARASLDRDEDELVDDSLENRPVLDTNDPETPHSLMEPEFERGNTPPKTRPRSSEESSTDGPIVLRRRVEAPPQQLDLTPGELRADQGASVTDHWNRSGTAEPRIELVERQQDRERDEANALIALYTDRGVGCKYRPKKKGKKSQNINFETSDQCHKEKFNSSFPIPPNPNPILSVIDRRNLRTQNVFLWRKERRPVHKRSMINVCTKNLALQIEQGNL